MGANIVCGATALCVFRLKSIDSARGKKDGVKRGMVDRGYEIRSDPCNGECRPDEESDADVIIVGAGVAGAALAYTLGKEFNAGLFDYLIATDDSQSAEEQNAKDSHAPQEI